MDQQKMKIAIHETGHAVMALICRQKVQKVSLREFDSPIGTDKYQAFTKLEPVDAKSKFTGEKAIQKIRISLGGYASEELFFGSSNIGGDDLTVAADLVGELLKIGDFKNWVAGLPSPKPSALDMIENPLIRRYIHSKMGECIEVLDRVKPAIQMIAEKLCERDELTGDEVSALFTSFIQSNSRNSF